ncbi:MAG: 4Fe-4S dicluster domain-containing protein [Thermodesulfovibrionales bacterium]
MISRRNFLKLGLAASAGAGLAAGGAGKLIAAEDRNLRWVFLVDTIKCVGCGLCVRACKLENEVPYDLHVSRTWVERYVLKKDGSLVADSPNAARDGFTRNAPQGEVVPADQIAKAFFVPKLCNQCDKPPCVQVCPVGATYRAPDGVVLVDRTWCIGCGYCIMACPYGVRFFHPVYKVAEKCNFCYHRIHRGMEPACVAACPFGARRIGNIRNPDDPVTKIIKTQRIDVLRPQLGSEPQAYYLGMDEIIR